ncbi:acylneuraminate cytidylyltransferase family protein [Pedobacter sp. GR22-6]|uniref:acylneuraminate cytidylyltransferase family protein n=1 Tax=Pedobacter sp. GR22-6 TaxID=3127957 RepID=UPI00307FC9F7
MTNKVAFFLPTRKGSQRVLSKNTRPFSDISGGILELKLKQLISSKLLDSIILSTNDELSIEIAKSYREQDSRVQIIERPEELCLDTTSLTDLIKYVPTITDAEHILWGHTTTPFVDGSDYDEAIESYELKLQEGFDSLISVTSFKNFLLDENAKIFNNNTSLAWPRTQDLPQLYELNHAVFLTSRAVYLNNHNRIGNKPFLYEMGKLKSVDIDWEEDFKIAEALYEKFFRL